MGYFGNELRFGLVKNINEDMSLIYVVIPDVILKFLIQYQSELKINIDKLTQFESEEIRYLYNEEVEELRSLAYVAIESLEDKNVCIFQEYRNMFNLTEINFSNEDVSEVFHHLIHLCNTVLNGQKILFISAGYDDSAFIEG